MESSTKILRRLLDERGVEWWQKKRHTCWKVSKGQEVEMWRAWEAPDGSLTLKVDYIYGLTPEQAIAATLGPKVTGNTSDGYHTFNELYHHRAVLFSVIVRDHRELAWKSMRHHDGTMYDGMFIVGIETPEGQATYHYDIDPYWDMFNCKELDQAPEWDGHTPSEAIERIATLGATDARPTQEESSGTCEADETDTWECVRYDLGGYGRTMTVHVMECSECGHVYEHVNGDYEYCPRCGRKKKGR